MCFSSAKRCRPRSLGADGTELQRALDGHFHINGLINVRDVRFPVYSDASTVSASKHMARAVSLECLGQRAVIS